MEKEKTEPLSSDSHFFEIGLVMAGAVSAGAYTAGVIDYLLDALDTWEQGKKEKEQGIPSHKVRIKVLSGASAGGMVCAITAAELINRENARDETGKLKANYKSLLYKAWVDKIDIKPLLGDSDIKGDKTIKSILNSEALDTIADEIIPSGKDSPKYVKLPDYITPELKMYLTLTNLRGLPYEFDVTGESGLPYGMDDHADYQYFELSDKTKPEHWKRLRIAAVATGAFPVGLQARLIERDTTEYEQRIAKNGLEISGKLKLDTKKGIPYPFVAVDGGALNNEPIELAASVWAPKAKPEESDEGIERNQSTQGAINESKKLQTEKGEFKMEIKDKLTPGKNALIIIDPFPNFASKNKSPTIKDTALSKIIIPLISAIRSQNLFKPEEMIMAADQCNYTRYLVAPVRRNDQDFIVNNALACGFFGGFGGFLSWNFRNHDYHLGRRNAQRFLEKYFIFPSEYFEDKDYVSKFQMDEVPMIPLIRQKVEGENNPWPSYSNPALKALNSQIKSRVSLLTLSMPLIGTFGKLWIKISMVVLGLIIVVAECLKLYSSFDQSWLKFFNVFYILIFQIIIGFILIMMLFLSFSKSILDHLLTKKTTAYIRSLLLEWGIEVKNK